jgi:signal transduction histidine kinase
MLWTGGLLLMIHMLMALVLRALPTVRGVHSGFAMLAGFSAMLGGFAIARGGLTPFRGMREALTRIRTGRQARIDDVYPAEVRPLIEELNGLLEDRERAIERAIRTAADLAHGLKTPLAVLGREPANAEQIAAIARRIDYHLARARAAASSISGVARCAVAPSAEALIRTLEKLHSERDLRIESHVEAGCSARIRREDLEEILGNLLENSCKWAAGRVVVSGSSNGESVSILVDDDGPGLAPELRAAVLERGVRADETMPGTGLGLAIVRDLCELYGGGIELGASPYGGLRARVRLHS